MNMVKKEDAGDKMIVNSNRSYRHHDTLRKACYALSLISADITGPATVASLVTRCSWVNEMSNKKRNYTPIDYN